MNVSSVFEQNTNPDDAIAPSLRALAGSSILAIAQEVRGLIADGKSVYNLTIGDFRPDVFPIPPALRDGIVHMYEEGHTNYPSAVGVPELLNAIRGHYQRKLGLDYPTDCILCGSGARPPIFAAFQAIVEPGDQVVYPVPSWNVNHYVFMNGAEGVPLVTSPDDGFLPTVEQIEPYIQTARILVINSPQNPSGTVIAKDQLQALCEAIVSENKRRAAAGERPLILLYDMVYWELTWGDYKHYTPVELVPEMANYTVMIDAISKSWAATGVRVGWCVAPPAIRAKMKALIGHMGAWAARPEQMATAMVLDEPELTEVWMEEFGAALQERLVTLRDGFAALRAAGHPVDSLDAQGAIYLSAKFDLHGRKHGDKTLETDEDIRSWLLHEAGVAVVPFTAFGYPEGSGYMRMSVGAATTAEMQDAMARIGRALEALS